MVSIVQKMLNSVGYKIEENGLCNQNMTQAIRDFQIKRDSLAIDSMVSYKTMMEIDSTIELSSYQIRGAIH